MAAPRPRPSQVALFLGVGFAVVTAGSGIVATLTQWHDPSTETREVFFNVPSALKAVFYVTLTVAFAAVGWLFSKRFEGYERGTPDRRATTSKNVQRRARDFRAGVYMQTLLRDGAAGLMHSLIYFPFLGLFAVTSILELNHQLPVGAKFLHGGVYAAWSAFGDLCGILFLVGLGWAFARRYISKVYRVRIKTRPEDGLILVTLFTLGLTGLLA